MADDTVKATTDEPEPAPAEPVEPDPVEPDGPAPDEPVRPRRGAKARAVAARFGRSFSVVGLVAAVLFFLGSLTPSLIPRTWPYQAVASGMSIASGYALGTFVGWLSRKLGVRPRWSPRWRRAGWVVFAGVGLGSVVAMMVLDVRWQSDLRELFGMPDVEPAFALVVVVALALALVALIVARALWFAIRAVAVLLDRWLPAVLAQVLAAVVVIVLAVLLVDGTVVRYVTNSMNAAYAAIDEGTEPGVTEPKAPERSGSPDSSVAWDSLGSQGRTFVAGGPSQHDLITFARQRGADLAVQVPIRVYAGLESAPDPSDTAALVVDELDRTDAWDRAVLVVATTTGTGWVDPSMADTIELMHGGDTAIAAMQYSYLPSWVSFVANRDTPPAAGKALFEAVYEAWSQRPEDDRPRLLVFGESLGSYGGQGAFSGLQDLSERTDGALWVGTPNFTENWRYFTDNRDPGSYEYSPVYREGEQVRWGTDVGDAADVWRLGPRWGEPRVVYVQHASDGVVWWSPDLILHEPDWLREPPGPDVLPALRWMPFVTFWQVSMDLFVAGAVPRGHGHNYVTEYSDGWAAIAPPEGWTDADTAALREVVAQRYDAAN